MAPTLAFACGVLLLSVVWPTTHFTWAFAEKGPSREMGNVAGESELYTIAWPGGEVGDWSTTARRARPIRRSDRILDQAVKIVFRINALKPQHTHLHGWFEAPLYVGMAGVVESSTGRTKLPPEFWPLFGELTTGGFDYVWHADFSAFATGSLEYYRLSSSDDPTRRAKVDLIMSPDGALDFAEKAIRYDNLEEPLQDWWTRTIKNEDGSFSGFGCRYWQDDVFMVLPWLSMLGSETLGITEPSIFLSRENIRNLAYEWIEAYGYDHRKEPVPSPLDPDDPNPSVDPIPDRYVPTERERRGPLLYNPVNGLWWHQPETIGNDVYWNRGNGWVAAGLAFSQQYLDAPYSGTLFDRVVTRDEVRAMLSQMAETLVNRRNVYGTWNSDIIDRTYTIPETSGSAFFVYMMAKGVNEGWLDADRYTPVVLKAFETLYQSVDEDYDLHHIQQGGVGPDPSPFHASDDTPFPFTGDLSVNDFDYGIGAYLMAGAEVARFPNRVLYGATGTDTRLIKIRSDSAGIQWDANTLKLRADLFDDFQPVAAILRPDFLTVTFHDETNEYWISPLEENDRKSFDKLIRSLEQRDSRLFSLILYRAS